MNKSTESLVHLHLKPQDRVTNRSTSQGGYVRKVNPENGTVHVRGYDGKLQIWNISDGVDVVEDRL